MSHSQLGHGSVTAFHASFSCAEVAGELSITRARLGTRGRETGISVAKI